MRKNLTEIVFILDRSGSMSGLERDTIGGFNSMIEKQKKAEGEALISTMLFDNVSEVLHDRVNVRDIRPMTDRDYTVRGCTALLDAIGGAIHHIGNVHKYARPEDVPEHTMFVITTDGMENASFRYNSEKVKQMIERQKAKYGWEFLFLGANIDAVETASHFGIGVDRAVNYQCDSEGTALNYEVVSEAIRSVRCSAQLSADWKKRIEMGEQAYTHCKKRLDTLISGQDSSGITKAVNWQGGGGYHFYELAPSLLVKNKRLPIYQINPEYTFEMLCEAICKIEGFKYKPDGVYHGHSSENRFIHITKEFVNGEYIRSIATTLGENQSLLIYSTKVQSDLRLPDNIEVKRIPKDLLDKCTFESEVR